MHPWESYNHTAATTFAPLTEDVAKSLIWQQLQAETWPPGRRRPARCSSPVRQTIVIYQILNGDREILPAVLTTSIGGYISNISQRESVL